MQYVSNAQIAKWFGPPCQQPVVTVKLAGSNVHVNKKVKRAFLWQELVFKHYPRLHKDLTERHLDDWGYSCRNVTGPARGAPVTIDKASKHAWALADDIDADENVRGTDAFKSEIWVKGDNGKCVQMLERSGFTWGGRFGTPDPHHFEVAKPPSWWRARFDRFGKPRRWYAKRIGWTGPKSRV